MEYPYKETLVRAAIRAALSKEEEISLAPLSEDGWPVEAHVANARGMLDKHKSKETGKLRCQIRPSNDEWPIWQGLGLILFLPLVLMLLLPLVLLHTGRVTLERLRSVVPKMRHKLSACAKK